MRRYDKFHVFDVLYIYVSFPLFFYKIMQQIYAWVDEIPLTRPKRNITRDFSDGGKIAVYGSSNTILTNCFIVCSDGSRVGETFFP